jgi:hypothetical protein
MHYDQNTNCSRRSENGSKFNVTIVIAFHSSLVFHQQTLVEKLPTSRSGSQTINMYTYTQ